MLPVLIFLIFSFCKNTNKLHINAIDEYTEWIHLKTVLEVCRYVNVCVHVCVCVYICICVCVERQSNCNIFQNWQDSILLKDFDII